MKKLLTIICLKQNLTKFNVVLDRMLTFHFNNVGLKIFVFIVNVYHTRYFFRMSDFIKKVSFFL